MDRSNKKLFWQGFLDFLDLLKMHPRCCSILRSFLFLVLFAISEKNLNIWDRWG